MTKKSTKNINYKSKYQYAKYLERCKDSQLKQNRWLQHNVRMYITFQPVTLKVFPALPIVTVRSHIPGNVAKENLNI